MATLSDIARTAGISISAVSRILSNDPRGRVSVETRERVRRIAEDLHYRPNFAGRALKSSRTFAVALIVPDLTNAIFSELMRGVEEESLDRGYMVLLARAEAMQPGGGGIERLIGENRVDGVLLQLGDRVPPTAVRDLAEKRIPTVLINSSHLDGISSVALPDQDAAALAVAHLVGLGHRRIGLLNGAPESDTAARRAEGFRSAMACSGLDVAERWVTSIGYAPRDGRDALRAALAEDRPTAVVVANVNAALGALLEARTLGVQVPEELSIVAIHDAWPAENSWPPLTCVRMPLYEMGRAAMRAIDERLTSGAIEDLVVPEPPQLIVRESTAAPNS